MLPVLLSAQLLPVPNQTDSIDEIDSIAVVRDAYGNYIGYVYHYRPNEKFELAKTKHHDKLPEILRWDVAPKAERIEMPVYPYEHAAAGRGGAVTVRFITGYDGAVREHEVISATAPEFALAVVAAMETWRFKPAQRNEKPCLAAVQLELRFEWKGGNGAVGCSEFEQRLLREQRKGVKPFRDYTKEDPMPQLVTSRPPQFPAARLSRRETGSAEIEVLIDRRGKVHLPRIVRATGDDFGYAAVHSVARWEFKRWSSARKPHVLRVRIPVEFNLPTNP